MTFIQQDQMYRFEMKSADGVRMRRFDEGRDDSIGAVSIVP